jgi:GNAT superfamily N-acetyltransferase
MSDANEARPLNAAEVDRAGAVLARAFQNDPFSVMLYPDPDTRAERLPRFFELAGQFGLQTGRVQTTGDVDGVAVWMPPGTTVHLDLKTLARFLSAPRRLGLGPYVRFLRLGRCVEVRHRRLMGDVPHWYLMLLGVEPALQGQGIGRRRLAPTLAEADRLGQPAYLETLLEQNLGFYGRLGFRVLGQGHPWPGAPLVWVLRRDPQPR